MNSTSSKYNYNYLIIGAGILSNWNCYQDISYRGKLEKSCDKISVTTSTNNLSLSKWGGGRDKNHVYNEESMSVNTCSVLRIYIIGYVQQKGIFGEQ